MTKRRIFMLTPGPKYNLEDTFRRRCENLSENYRGIVVTSSDCYRVVSYGEFKIICLKDPFSKSFIIDSLLIFPISIVE